MAPIPVYTNSPITAAKPDGVTPKTEPSKSQRTSTPTSTSASTPATYAAAQPGATPSLPTPTRAVSSSALHTTPTTSIASASPAPPQPGSVPVSGVPPPPKVGERYQPPTQDPTATMPYPEQMAIPGPTIPYSQQRGTSTATAASPYQAHVPSGNVGAESLSHPTGYQQNVNASEFDRYQRTAMEQRELDDGGEGMWGAAKKLAQQTGERLVAVENEVWKKINRE
ncbi:hypothetical protein F5B22DRAFT_164913 [Xylaria bambusicola]|uniref:uncharacterized protein n=1 Tax=Xylaria bambusicola TaxID=326684 RepID=UPI00200833F3|nr:uncharacterized protein F5B22DRAFT_164913 [Xylaria bambusicola]KAI0526546.1 hypothetical protein F5B22DRAFT_164913 [Xylaria bambusicola]